MLQGASLPDNAGLYPALENSISHLGCLFPAHSQLPPALGAASRVALKGNRLHLPREKDPDHRVEDFWIHIV